MKLHALAPLALLWKCCSARDDDLFYYGLDNQGNTFGQKNWGDVTCSDINTCTGYPDKFPDGKGFTLAENSNCQYCPEGGPDCGLHRQSPIDLKRDVGILTSPDYKDCPDWHWMKYEDDTCNWNDMKDHFTIERHALHINTPQLSNGDIACLADDGTGWRRYARLDYSKGFPDWWWLQRTEINVPSQHVQEGIRYAAEVNLAHFYEIEHPKNKLGYVTMAMQDYPDAESWAYLDKMICAWRREEEKGRAKCGLDPAPPYGRCALFRGQQPTEEWLLEAAGGGGSTGVPTAAPIQTSSVSLPTKQPTIPPTTIPVEAPTIGPVGAPTNGPVTEPTTSPVNESTKTPTFGSFGSFPLLAHGAIEVPSPKPSMQPATIATKSPTLRPTAKFAPTTSSPTTKPVEQNIQVTGQAPFSCADYSVSYDRMCQSSDPCCESVRSDTSFCWDLYENVFPADAIYVACSECCSKQIGPPAAQDASYAKTIKCADVPDSHRMCKSDGCCQNPRSQASYCQDMYSMYGSDVDQICHFCCSEPQEVGPARRRLRSAWSNKTQVEVENYSVGQSAESPTYDDDRVTVPESSRVVQVGEKQFLLRPENFEVHTEDDQDYFDEINSNFKKRHLQNAVHLEDYEDIDWYPYEWLLKVQTEYYFRYEGTMMVPPCWETVHYRFMKDPIRVHKRQIQELTRLLAWRVDANTCQRDTAGVVSSDGNSINVSRDLMATSNLHRVVFCECKDWPSKFDNDREWCNNWKSDVNYDRFYKDPYSFNSGDKWLPY